MDESKIKTILDDLRKNDNYRVLRDFSCDGKYITDNKGRRFLNFSSNDYLGLGSVELQSEFMKTIDVSQFFLSNPSSRLMTGNSIHYNKLESTINSFFGKSSLVVSSGYLANAGILAAITEKTDNILADKLSHASIIDGLSLSKAQWTRFRHNDMEHLESLLKKCTGDTIVVTESVFSMDGDIAPLRELVELKKRYGFKIYIDEAHAFGVMGEKGLGVAEDMGLLDEIDIIVATLGKGIPSHGAFIVCDELMREWFINNLRTLIFSTALPPVSLMWSDFLISNMVRWTDKREKLRGLISLSKDLFGNEEIVSQIIPIIIGDNKRTLELSSALADNGFWVSAIRYPTVPKDSARLRLSLSSAIDEGELREFHNCLCKFK